MGSPNHRPAQCSCLQIRTQLLIGGRYTDLIFCSTSVANLLVHDWSRQFRGSVCSQNDRRYVITDYSETNLLTQFLTRKLFNLEYKYTIFLAVQGEIKKEVHKMLFVENKECEEFYYRAQVRKTGNPQSTSMKYLYVFTFQCIIIIKKTLESIIIE